MSDEKPVNTRGVLHKAANELVEAAKLLLESGEIGFAASILKAAGEIRAALGEGEALRKRAG